MNTQTQDQRAAALSLRALADIAERDGVEAMQAASAILQELGRMDASGQLWNAIGIFNACRNMTEPEAQPEEIKP